MILTITDIYNNIIIEHGTKPKNFFELKKQNYYRIAINKLCGDKLEIFLFVENKIIKNISFKGTGCILSIASASIMTTIIKKKSLKQSLEIFLLFRNLLLTKNTKKIIKNTSTIIENKSNNEKLIKKLINVKILPNRIKCITLAWYALYDILKNSI